LACKAYNCKKKRTNGGSLFFIYHRTGLRSPVIIVLVLVSTLLNAQGSATKVQADSLRTKLFRDSSRIFRKTFAKPYLKIENRFSFVSGENINLPGVMAGATMREKHTLSLGYFFLARRNNAPISMVKDNKRTNNYLSFYYYELMYQYILLNSRFLQLNIPFGIGYGTFSTVIKDTLDRQVGSASGNMIPVNTGLLAIIKPIKWAGISATGGYRFVRENENLQMSLEGWFYSFGLWVDARQIYRSIRFAEKKKQYHREMRALGY
jgi:hypothetical protein